MVLNKKNKAYTVKTLLIIALLLLVSSAQGLNLLERMNEVAEQAWYDQYIPESSIPTIPLNEYDDFEVTELFRSVTIEDLEASITDGYPMPWLEEILKDESIPWEDRYWLDCRVRAAIAQNTHTFFNPAGSPILVDADAIFPGELYWREHMIVDPSGASRATESNSLERPINLEQTDIGYLFNSFGRQVGHIALSIPIRVSLSRDGTIGVTISGGNDVYNRDRQPYACFLYPDGSFKEIPLSTIGIYNSVISSSGNIAAFSLVSSNQINLGHTDISNSDIEVFSGEGEFINSIDTYNLTNSKPVNITYNGRFLCHKAEDGNICLVDCLTGESHVLEKPTWDQNTFRCRFSPDGSKLVLSGATIDRIVNLQTFEEAILPFYSLQNSNSSYSSYSCAGAHNLNSSIVYSQYGDMYSRTLYLESKGSVFFSAELLTNVHFYPLEAEFSPNSALIIVNPIDAAWGLPSAHENPEFYNLPLVIMQIESR